MAVRHPASTPSSRRPPSRRATTACATSAAPAASGGSWTSTTDGSPIVTVTTPHARPPTPAPGCAPDASTTDRWFFVTVMGRHAGHLALAIGGAAAATLTVIGEEFGDRRISVDHLAGVLEGAIVKRHAQGREHGVAILAESLATRLDGAAPGSLERDPHGNMRLADLELGRLLKERVTQSLQP